jgi:hypothetical protein
MTLESVDAPTERGSWTFTASPQGTEEAWICRYLLSEFSVLTMHIGVSVSLLSVVLSLLRVWEVGSSLNHHINNIFMKYNGFQALISTDIYFHERDKMLCSKCKVEFL